ncbi:glycoside hydrolase family 130 protein [Pedobacter sp. SYP-B3415]|uniref:glycoside hydrolase family 130 protein n=1 Tax=Pedobacter sp. SYP-B3415 TaxID=2496641 RepID=UPI00101C0E8C|nr:glycoside hydrolase family 130 protein [Pedobacter sp. SYP-B3415]
MKKYLLYLLLPFSLQAIAQQSSELPKWAFGPFVRPQGVNPVISPDSTTKFNDPMTGQPVAWQANDTFNPGAAIKDGKIYVLYRAEDKSGIRIGHRTSRLGLAESADGLSFTRRPEPVLFPGDDEQREFEWKGGCEDPRVSVTSDGTYLVLYTQWNNKVPRIGAATSKDFIHWKKHGPVFRHAHGGRFHNIASKSASVLTRVVGGKQIMAKYNGKYLMYWGERHVYAAVSSDLVNWEPLVNKDGSLKILMSPRKGYFDSDLTECGPPAIWTNQGVVLLYNGKNLGNENASPDFPRNTYTAGQALFDVKDPLKFVSRLDKPFFFPVEDFEKSGQYPAGTVFIEGMVLKDKKWYLYYGCADSRVSVAVAAAK